MSNLAHEAVNNNYSLKCNIIIWQASVLLHTL